MESTNETTGNERWRVTGEEEKKNKGPVRLKICECETACPVANENSQGLPQHRTLAQAVHMPTRAGA